MLTYALLAVHAFAYLILRGRIGTCGSLSMLASPAVVNAWYQTTTRQLRLAFFGQEAVSESDCISDHTVCH